MHTTEQLLELARRGRRTISVYTNKEGYSVRIDGREYKITLEQYKQLLDWLSGVPAANNK